jgi:hypothetical protein
LQSNPETVPRSLATENVWTIGGLPCPLGWLSVARPPHLGCAECTLRCPVIKACHGTSAQEEDVAFQSAGRRCPAGDHIAAARNRCCVCRGDRCEGPRGPAASRSGPKALRKAGACRSQGKSVRCRGQSQPAKTKLSAPEPRSADHCRPQSARQCPGRPSSRSLPRSPCSVSLPFPPKSRSASPAKSVSLPLRRTACQSRCSRLNQSAPAAAA